MSDPFQRMHDNLVCTGRQHDGERVTPEKQQYRRDIRGLIFIFGTAIACLVLAIVVMLWCARPSHAMEGDGHSASPNKEWFAGLKNSKGDACCSDADGTAVLDADWEGNAEGKYRVRIKGDWYVVPDEAVLPGPNMDGRTIVWPIRGSMGTTIRCFIPGTMG